MLNSNRRFRPVLWLIGALLVVGLTWVAMNENLLGADAADVHPRGVTPLAVLGDSDSHSYQDRISFPSGSPERGGAYRAATFQWTEVIGRLRGQALDLGRWGTWGTRGSVARVAEWLGLAARAPRKEDFRHNFAVSGAGCGDLLAGGWRQTPRLLQLMDEDPTRWRTGVVVIRMGVNSFGKAVDLERLATDPGDSAVAQVIDGCLSAISESVSAIRARHPQTRFVLVGIFNNVHWVKYVHRWQDPTRLRNISSGLDRFDEGLRRIAASGDGIAFFDDRAWFASHWGGRDEAGKPAYKAVSLGGTLRIAHSLGDEPTNAVVADGHAGTAWNALWARALIDVMNKSFKLGVAPLEEAELAGLLEGSRNQAP